MAASLGTAQAALGRIGDLALINILFLICSIPIITLGASAAALYTVGFQMVRGEEKQIAKIKIIFKFSLDNR